MARKCLVCSHKDRQKIDFGLINGLSYRSIAKQYGISPASVYRHKQDHLPEKLSKAKESTDQKEASDTMDELIRCLKRVNKLFDACHEWLQDPDDPEKYSLEPRDNDVTIIYSVIDPDIGKPVRKKAPISKLLAEIRGAGYLVESWETKRADPRKLILDTAGRLGDLIKILTEVKDIKLIEDKLSEIEKTVEANGGSGKRWA